MIVRELVAFLGIDFDRRGAAEAESRFKQLKNTMSTLAQVASAGLIARGLWEVVESASAVEETMNVIQQTFKENTQGVLEWSERVGKEMGRSQYSMREMVGAFGALLGPSQKNLQVTTEMSEGLARLAVDLGSFYNISDSEAQTRLFSAMTGETEAVERLGVNIKVLAMEEWMHQKGIKKKWKELTYAQKQQQIYNKILEDTIDKQGDAVRTAGGFANSTKRLKEQIRDLSVSLGQQLMGPASYVLGIFNDFAAAFTGMAQKSGIAESVLITLGVLAAVLGASFLLANAGVVAFIAGLAGITAVVNDVEKALNGGKSVIGDFFTALIGKKSWEEVRETWRKGMEDLGNFMWEATHPEEAAKRKQRGQKTTGPMDWINRLFGRDPEKMREFEEAYNKAAAEQDTAELVENARRRAQIEENNRRAAGSLGGPLTNEAARGLGRGVRKAAGAAYNSMGVGQGGTAAGGNTSSDLGTVGSLLGDAASQAWGAWTSGIGALNAWKARQNAAQAVQQNNTTVIVQGNADRGTAREIGRRVQEANDNRNRNLKNTAPVAPAKAR